MKKYVVLIIVLCVLLTVTFYKSMEVDLSPEDVLSEVLQGILVYNFEELNAISSDDISIYGIKRLSLLRKYFTEDSYNKFSMRLSDFTSIYEVYQLKCDVNIDEISFDTREIDSSIVIYYSLLLNFTFEDKNKESIKIQLNGDATIIKDGENFKVNSIHLLNRRVKDLLE